MNVDTANQK